MSKFNDKIELFTPFVRENSGENVVYYPVKLDGNAYHCYGFVQDIDHFFTGCINKDESVKNSPDYSSLFEGFTEEGWDTFIDPVE